MSELTLRLRKPLLAPTRPLFKNEREMKQHFAKNLHRLEPGLRLYTEKGLSGIEVPCRITNWGRQGSIDILAVDSDGALVVVECKLKYGDAAALGQLLGYMAWFKRRLSAPPLPSGDEGKAQRHSAPGNRRLFPVRGFLVVKRANPILRLLIAELNSWLDRGTASKDSEPALPITVFEYEDSLELTKLQPANPSSP